MGNRFSIDKKSITPVFEVLDDGNVIACCGSIIGAREEQEDTEIIQELNIPNHYIYGIFDGHGGDNTSKYIKKHFIKKFINSDCWKKYCSLSEDDRNDFDFTTMFETFFVVFDLSMKNKVEKSGSTATVVLQTPTKYICANLGDSEAWLLGENNTIKLSTIHKPTHDSEKKRITKNGGFVKNGRVNGNLAVSRAFGDFHHKKNSDNPKKMHVSPIPSVKIFDRSKYEGTLLLACDGFFDIMNNRRDMNETYIQELLYDINENQDTLRRIDKTIAILKKRKRDMEAKGNFEPNTNNKKRLKCGRVVYDIYENDEILNSEKETYGIPIVDTIMCGSPIKIDQIIVKPFDCEMKLRQFYVEMLIRYVIAEGSNDNVTLMLVTNNNSDVVTVKS